MGRTNAGRDLQAVMMGGDTATGDTGTSTAIGATSLTDTGKTWTTNQWTYHVVTDGSVYGNILSNTATVLTIDRWNNPATPGGAAGTTPGATATYMILPAVIAAMFIALSANASPAASDTALTGEITTASGGLIRKIAPYAHTASATTYTLTPVFTANGNDSLPVTIASIGMFTTVKGATGQPVFTTAVSPTAVLSASGDQLTITEQVTMA